MKGVGETRSRREAVNATMTVQSVVLFDAGQPRGPLGWREATPLCSVGRAELAFEGTGCGDDTIQLTSQRSGQHGGR